MHHASLTVDVSNTRPSILKQSVEEGRVLATKLLTADGEPAKKHVEIQLPAGVSYMPGDYLSVLPINPKETVQRAMRRFGLPVTWLFSFGYIPDYVLLLIRFSESHPLGIY